MPLLQSGEERCAFQVGTYTLGGHGPNALPIPSLEAAPEAATIVVPPDGAPTIQRLTASILVRIDQTPIGIAPKSLDDGVEIEFSGCRLTYHAEEGGHTPIASTTSEYAVPTPKARVVNVRTGDVIDLSEGRVVVGRDESCDVVLSGMAVSRRHFSITPVQGGYQLRDESANGTLVNGSPVSGTYLLGHGDVVRIDDEELRFEADGAPEKSSSNTGAPTAILDVTRLRAEHAASGKREATSLTANLEIVRGPYSGASFSLDKPVCSIGRGPQNDVRIRDESVSGSHATLLRKGATWFVVDLRSANGTFVDGLRIAGERELASGSRLTLGRVELVFRALDGGIETSDSAKRKRSWIRELLKTLRGRDTSESAA